MISSASRVTVKFLAQHLICLLLIRISAVTGFQGHVAYCFIYPLEGFTVHISNWLGQYIVRVKVYLTIDHVNEKKFESD